MLRLVMSARVPQAAAQICWTAAFFMAQCLPDPIPKETPKTMTTLPTCPTCDAPVPMPIGVVAHELITCPDCGTELEVLSVTPFTLDLAPETEEDWGE